MNSTLFFDRAIYCSGGNRDGYFSLPMLKDSLGRGTWRGTLSNSWDVAGNWTYDLIPTVNDHVFIPAGCVNYPYLTSGLSINDISQTYKCKTLDIEAGAQMATSNSNLSVYGRMTVAGNYTATNNVNLAQNIYSGGSLQILNEGIVRFGNQSSGSGLSDLNILPGGKLEVAGGVLEIDDQLNIGGSFNMTGGYVFAHKYGNGSSITAISGPFVVSPGASGNISGGIIRVCGKDGGNLPAIALNDPDFDFTGSSILLVTNGVSATRSDPAIKTVNGSEFHNLWVMKTGFNTILSSDMVINGQVFVSEGASLLVQDGNTVFVNGGLGK
jgi:hypothetical protein